MLRVKELETIDLNAAHHVGLRAAPAQLFFGRDMFFPVQHVANWHATHNRNLLRAQDHNRRENRGRVQRRYRVGDLVLSRRDRGNDVPNFGPFRITAVHSNGTVTIDRRRYREIIHIPRLIPYHR